MDFKFVSKNNIGAVATLVLIIVLSQSRFFDFLILHLVQFLFVLKIFQFNLFFILFFV